MVILVYIYLNEIDVRKQTKNNQEKGSLSTTPFAPAKFAGIIAARLLAARFAECPQETAPAAPAAHLVALHCSRSARK